MFTLAKPDQDGNSLKDHLEQIERQTGKKPKDLIPPVEFPVEVAHVWSAFLTLSRRRSAGMSGNPLSFSEIKTWMELTHTELKPWEVEAITDLDDVYMKVQYG